MVLQYEFGQIVFESGGGKHADFETRGRWVGVFHFQNFNKYHDTNWVVPNERTVIFKKYQDTNLVVSFRNCKI